MFETDRPRGILSKADRKLLRGESDIEPQSQQERNARARIRERVGNGLRDFQLLADPAFLEERDLEMIRSSGSSASDSDSDSESMPDYSVIDQPREPVVPTVITESLCEMVAFAYRMKPEPRFIEEVVKVGVRRGLERQGSTARISDVKMSIEDRETLTDRLGAYLDAGWQLSRWEVTFALQHEIRPPDEIATHVQNTGFRGDDWSPRSGRREMPFPVSCPECGSNIDEEGYCIECGAASSDASDTSDTSEDGETDATGTDSTSE